MSKMILTQRDDCKIRNRVACIKYMRAMTGYSLKDAKDAIEGVRFGNPVTVEIADADAVPATLIGKMWEEGIQIDHYRPELSHNVLIVPLKELLGVAVLECKYDLASDLLELLQKHDK